jgi:hypothetical protein
MEFSLFVAFYISTINWIQQYIVTENTYFPKYNPHNQNILSGDFPATTKYNPHKQDLLSSN